jgi:hypothetical protein
MNEGAINLVDHVLPDVPVRQFVLTMPFPLRFPLAFDGKLLGQVVRIFTDTVAGWYCKRQVERGLPAGETGAVTVIRARTHSADVAGGKAQTEADDPDESACRAPSGLHCFGMPTPHTSRGRNTSASTSACRPVPSPSAGSEAGNLRVRVQPCYKDARSADFAAAE